jgi:hypothetical protein
MIQIYFVLNESMDLCKDEIALKNNLLNPINFDFLI